MNKPNTINTNTNTSTNLTATVVAALALMLAATLALTACGNGKQNDENLILSGGFDEGDAATIAIPVAVHTVNMLNTQFRVGHSQLTCSTTGCIASGSAISDTLTITFANYTSGYSSFNGDVVVSSANNNVVLTSSNLKTTVYTQFKQSDYDLSLNSIELNQAGEITGGAASLGGAVQNLDQLKNDQGVFISYATLAASYALINNVSRICSGESCSSKDRLHAIVTKSEGNSTTLSQTRNYNMTSIATYINSSMGNFDLKHSDNMENKTRNKLKENLADNEVYLTYSIVTAKGNANTATSNTQFNNAELIQRQSKYQSNGSLMNLKGRALFKNNYVTFVESSPSCKHNTKSFHVIKASAVPQNIAKQYEEFGAISYLQTDLSGDGNPDITLIIKNTMLDKCDSGEPIFQIIGPVDGLIGANANLTNANVNNGNPWKLDELFLNVYYDPYIINNTANIATYYYR